MKQCTKCKKIKKIAQFYKDVQKSDGLRCVCKTCVNKERNIYIKKNPQKVRLVSKRYYYNNKNRMIKLGMERMRTRDNGLYLKYWNMKSRCKKSFRGHKYYYDKNISVEWTSYQDFKKDMYRSFIKHLKIYGIKQTSLDRINGSKNYSKNNCRWATRKEQTDNVDKKNISSLQIKK